MRRDLGRPTGVVLAIGLLLAAACSPAPPAAPAAKPSGAAPAGASNAAGAASAPSGQAASPLLQQLIEGAKQETTLRGSWGGGTLGGSPGLNDFVSAINKKYGLNVQAQYTPGRDMQGMIELLAREQAADQASTTDLYLGNSQGILDAAKFGVFKSMDWPALLDRPLPSEPDFDPIAPDAAAVAYATIIVGIPYNTNLVRGDDIPRRMEDVFKPQWKGRIASTPYAAGLREFAMPEMLGRDYVLDYTRRLSSQISGLIRCGEDERLISGEFAMLVFSCGGQNVTVAQRKGAPIGYTTVQEASVLHMMYAAIPKNSKAPNAAALLITYLHSPEGQQLLWEHDAADYHLYPESNTKKVADEVRAAGGKLAKNSPQWLAAQTNYTQQQQELERILREGGQ
jgi:ABC-type Fe3+ transport system substrate-binding protein